MWKVGIIVICLIISISCDSKKDAHREMQNALEVSRESERNLRNSIQQANALLDSIHVLTEGQLIAGENQNMTVRLRSVHEHIQAMQVKIAHTENELKKTRIEAQAYMMMADAYKNEAQLLDRELRIADSLKNATQVSMEVSARK